MFELFLNLAYYQPCIIQTDELEQYIDDLFWKVCCHLQETYPNNLLEYVDIDKTKIRINQLDVPKMQERLESIFYQVGTKFGTLFSLKLYRMLDKKPDGYKIPIEEFLAFANKIRPVTVQKLYRQDIESFLDMYEYKTRKKFERV